MSDWNPHQNVITTADNHKIVYKSNTSSSKWSILPQVFPRLHSPTAPHQLFLLLHMQCRSGAALLSILSQFSGSGGQKSQLAGRERWRHCVSRHCWVWNCELRTSVKIWESINGGEAKPYGLRPPTGPPPSPATLDKGQRWRKEPCALLALSQHKTVGFQIFRFDRRFVHFFVFALKCEGCSVGALWSSGLNDNLVSRAESSPDGEIGKIGFEMTTKNPQFPFSKRLKWRDGCRRFKLPDSSSRAWIYELFMILRPVEITLIYLQQFELCGSGKVGNFGHFKGHYLRDCL